MSARCMRCGRPYAECLCGWPRGLLALTALGFTAAELCIGPGWSLPIGCAALAACVALREVT